MQKDIVEFFSVWVPVMLQEQLNLSSYLLASQFNFTMCDAGS